MTSGYSEGKTGMPRLGNISIYKNLNVTSVCGILR